MSKGYIVKCGMKQSVLTEKAVQMMCDSLFIVRLFETYKNDVTLYFLLEAALGGELYATYNKKGFFGKDAACSGVVAMAAKEAAERQGLDKFLSRRNVEGVVQEMLELLLRARPEDPRKFLLAHLEEEEGGELTDSDLQRLFMASRRITGKIVPQETISVTISETRLLLNCDAVSLFVLDKKLQMLRLYASNSEQPIMVRLGQGIAGDVFVSQEVVNIPDCYQDNRFDQSFDTATGYYTRSMVVVPITDFDGRSCGVLQAINKMPSGETKGPKGQAAIPFSRQDVKVLLHLVQHVAIAIQNADVYREAIDCSERGTGLLNTIQSMSQDLGMQSLLATITMHASKICSAERAAVFLLDNAAQQLRSLSDIGAEICVPRDKGIEGECFCQAKVINIPDAYADPRFDKQVDVQTGLVISLSRQTVLPPKPVCQHQLSASMRKLFSSRVA
ncbi:unnamed protein product [Effrenium voratum]|nr:unnamed protein product [Effrenium voratum]